MSPALVFFFGLFILVLFGWYFATDSARGKRWLGLVLTVLLVAFCVQEIMPPEKKIRLGLDLKGGTSFLLKLVREPGAEPINNDLLQRAVEVIRKRVDSLGVSEPDIAPQGSDRILVQIAGLSNEAVDQAKAQLQRVAKLEFAIVRPDSDALLAQIASGQAIMPPGFVVKTMVDEEASGKKTEEKLLVSRRADMGGDHVKKAFAYFDQQGYGVNLEFDGEGAKLFDALAANNVNNRLAILLDGEVISAPVLRTANFNGRAQISGNFSEKEARDLASALENPLRVPVQIEEIRSVSPTLGADSIKSGVYAGVGGLILVCIFVLLYYRLPGIVALVGLSVNLLLLVGMMAMFGFVLTLPGIAGIILTIGMAVDANVLIYERLREELKAGKSLPAALTGAYDKAFSAIFDANITTLITSVILFIEATGSVRGFAVTLTLGIIASMFSALLVTRTIFRWWIEKGGLKSITMLDIIPKKQFDFLGQRWRALYVSLFLIIGSAVVFAVRGADNFGIDFRGGDILSVSSTLPVSVDEARAVTNRLGVEDAVIQMERQGTADLLTIRSPEGTADKILTGLRDTYPDRGVTRAGQDTVGARIGLEFAQRSAWALALGMLGILIYVTVRFEFSFALGAVVAVIHDIVITIGVFSLFGGQLSLVMVGAILTIAGYSINDTIVVFDRIREALKTGEGGTIQQVMNRAINETLGRTILTGGTTLLSLLALYLFGGAVLRDFAFAILAGILIGTYSSIFVAAPVVLWWSRFRGKSIRREVLDNEAARQTPRPA